MNQSQGFQHSCKMLNKPLLQCSYQSPKHFSWTLRGSNGVITLRMGYITAAVNYPAICYTQHVKLFLMLFHTYWICDNQVERSLKNESSQLNQLPEGNTHRCPGAADRCLSAAIRSPVILYFVVGFGHEGCVCAHFCVTAVLSQFQHSTTFFSLISGSPCAGLSKKTKDVEEKKRKQDEDAAD